MPWVPRVHPGSTNNSVRFPMSSSGNSFSWYWNRLRLMSVAEVIYRAGTQLRLKANKAGLLDAGGVPARIEEPDTFAMLVGIDQICAQPYLDRADAVLRGELDIFANKRVVVGHPPLWYRDSFTGIEMPRCHGPSMRIVGYGDGFDIKTVWEPARHQHWPWLIQAWLLSGEDRYIDGIRVQLVSWLDANPFPIGPHWTSALEVAIRLINWSWVWRMSGGAHGSLFCGHPELLERFLEAVYLQQWFISRHLSKFSSANNHLIGEAAGWYVSACTWPLWRSSRDWARESKAILEVEIIKQHSADGVNREQAFAYQSFVCELFLAAGLVRFHDDGHGFSDGYWECLEKSIEFLANISDTLGRVPNFGDADDGAALKLGLTERPNWREQMSVLAVLRGRGDFKQRAGMQEDALMWWLGPHAIQLWHAVQDRPWIAKRDFRDGGYFVMGDESFDQDSVKLVADVGALGYLSIAAHGHSDALHFTLSVGGQPVLVDPGTGCYSAYPQWRNYFRSTQAHNTVRVDGEDQSLSAGPFMWMKHARTCLLKWETADRQQILEAEHDGYTRLNDPLIHRRRWTYDEMSRCLVLEDIFSCAQSHFVELLFHLSPKLTVALVDHVLTVETERWIMIMELPVKMTSKLIHGDESGPFAWYSDGYLQREASVACVVEGQVTPGLMLRTTVRIEQKPYSNSIAAD